MKKIARKNEFIEVELIETERKSINKTKVTDAIKAYLSKHQINGKHFSFVGYENFNCSFVTIEIKQIGDNLYLDGILDGDFVEDQEWADFCDKMKETLELRYFGVPLHEYADQRKQSKYE